MNCQSERNLCDELRKNGSGWKTWNNIGRWSKALLDGNEEYPHDMSKERRVEQLKRIAVMNLKKEGGINRTKGNELLDSVMAQHKRIILVRSGHYHLLRIDCIRNNRECNAAKRLCATKFY